MDKHTKRLLESARLTTELHTLFEDRVIAAVRDAIQALMDEECQRIIAEARDKLEDSITKIVASASIKILRQVSIEQHGTELVIHVHLEGS